MGGGRGEETDGRNDAETDGEAVGKAVGEKRPTGERTVAARTGTGDGAATVAGASWRQRSQTEDRWVRES
jgi:hypothetical protein